MGNPEGGSGDRKDKYYFSQEIEKLTDEAVSSGEKEIAIVLSTLNGLIALNKTYELSELCADLAKKELQKLTDLKKEPKN